MTKVKPNKTQIKKATNMSSAIIDDTSPAFRVIRGLYADQVVQDPPTTRSRPTFVSGPTQVNQAFLEEADVNNVILRFAGTGELPPRLNAAQAEFLDVSEMPDFHTALNTAQAAQAAFDALPASVRAFVNHDPAQLVEAYDHLTRLRQSEPDVTTPAPANPPAPTPAP